MGWLDSLEKTFGIEPDEPEAPRVDVAKVFRKKSVVQEVWVQTRARSGAPGDMGSAEQAFYVVEDGTLTLCNEQGQKTGKPYPLEIGENPRAVAGRLKRREVEKPKPGELVPGFNRPIFYRGRSCGVV